MKENRNLKSELKEIKLSIERKPQLTVRLGMTKPEKDEKQLEFYQRNELMQVDENGIVHLKIRAFSEIKEKADFGPISSADVPEELKQYVSEQEIINYNKALPTREVWESYIQECHAYNCLKENGIAITFYVDNIGTAKATDVSVKIIFPKDIVVYLLSEIVKIGKPKAPVIPESPIKKGYTRLQETKRPFWGINIQEDLRLSSINNSALQKAIVRGLEVPVEEMIEIDNNTVEFEHRYGIVHTKSIYFPGAYIIPLRAGEYDAKVIIMCAEYDSPKETTIKFIVEE